MKRHEPYQASNVGWLGGIPKHWDCLKVGSLFSQRNTKVSDRDYAPLSVTKNGVVPQLATAAKSNDGDNRKLVCVGDFVINSRSDRKGSCGVSDFDGSVSLINIVLEPRQEWNGRYVHYLLRSQPFSEEFYRWGRGIVADLWTTRYSEMKNILLPVPSRAEQDQVVRFLDWKTSRINQLINVHKKEIDKLEELKRSRISNLVMGAAYPGQRQSEVSWVKTIPKHWEETKLIQAAHEQKIKNAGLAEKNLLSLSYGKIVNKDIGTTDGLLPASFEGYQIVYPGNIILRLTDLQNDHKSLRTGYVTQTGIITSAYTCIKHRENISPEYLQLQLHAADLCKVFYGMGGGVRQSIGFDDIKKLVIALPPLSEQMKIVKKAYGIDARINTVASKYKGVISLLNEYKSRLISDVVTGQIDVRDVEIPEYERVEEIADSNSENDEAELEDAGSEVE